MSDTYKPCEITVKRGPEKMDLSPKKRDRIRGFQRLGFKWRYMGAQSGTEVYTDALTVTGRW